MLYTYMYSVHVIKNSYYDIVKNNMKSNGGGGTRGKLDL